MTSPARVPNASPAPRRTTVLFVCHANICRSPAMRFFTEHFIRAQGLEPRWQFASAGVSTVPNQSICDRSAAAINKVAGGAEFKEGHRAKALTQRAVRTAGLILVASREERAAVALIDPSARSRTFTMIEAGRLIDTASRLVDDSAPGFSRTTSLADVAAILHRTRGMEPPPETTSRWKRAVSKKRGPSTIDILDVHTGQARNHVAMVADVRWAGSRLATTLGKNVPRPSGANA